MKNLILSTVLVLGIASCCKEKAPDGLVLVDSSITVDTSYTVSPIPNAQLKNVFIEEFTGVRCQPCAAAGAALHSLQQAIPGRILAAKVHAEFQSIPVKETDPDLRCPAADALNAVINPAGNKPKAGIDRLFDNVNATYMYNFTGWAGIINAQLAKTSPINLNLSVENYDGASKLVALKSMVTFTQSYNDSINYHIYVLENGIIATQDSTGGVELDDYEHEEVLRDIITPVGTGSPWLNTISPKPAGLEALKFTSFTLPANVTNPTKCVILVAVQNARTKEMIQVSEVNLQ
jgi:hypothetical protein